MTGGEAGFNGKSRPEAPDLFLVRPRANFCDVPPVGKRPVRGWKRHYHKRGSTVSQSLLYRREMTFIVVIHLCILF